MKYVDPQPHRRVEPVASSALLTELQVCLQTLVSGARLRHKLTCSSQLVSLHNMRFGEA
jgi:hypothetical protein